MVCHSQGRLICKLSQTDNVGVYKVIKQSHITKTTTDKRCVHVIDFNLSSHITWPANDCIIAPTDLQPWLVNNSKCVFFLLSCRCTNDHQCRIGTTTTKHTLFQWRHTKRIHAKLLNGYWSQEAYNCLTILMKSCSLRHIREIIWRRNVNQDNTNNFPSNIL